MPNRLTPMATDGQGVLLAVNQSSDTRQRTTMDILSRRVAHRLGCPVTMVHVQRGVPLMQAPLEHLADKGVRSAVLVPVDPYQARIDSFNSGTGPVEVGVNGTTISVRLAEGIGADPLLVDCVLESLAASEREADDDTVLMVAIPETHNGIAKRLAEREESVRAAGWGGLGFVEVPAQIVDSVQPLPIRVAKPLPPSALVVPLAINPGPFVNRCEGVVPNLKAHFEGGIDFAPATLHATSTLGQMIRDRVQRARRN